MNGWLITFAHWLQNTPWAVAIATSDYAYPFVQLTHFTGLSLWVGTSIAVDLRLMGFGRREPASQLLDTLLVWNWIGFGITVVGGFTLFSIAASSYVSNPAFRYKLGVFIPLALVMHIVVQSSTRKWSQGPHTPAVARFAGLLEVLLWLAVASCAVSIPYF